MGRVAPQVEVESNLRENGDSSSDKANKKEMLQQIAAVKDLSNHITKFIEGIRIQMEGNDSQAAMAQPNGGLDDPVVQARRKSEDMILDAEHFRATINPPPGNEILNSNKVDGMDVDDQFFHITCHVDQALHAKIQRGEFVDLEKLLPKNRKTNSESKLDLVYRDGHSFFVPASAEVKINGVRKWEQAFRIYAAIYSESNPSRAAEIW